MRSIYKTAIAAGFVGAVAVAATAFGQTGTPSPTDPAAKDRRKAHRVVHSETKVQTDDGFALVIRDHGEITAVDGSRVTIKRLDGETVTVAAGEDTRIRRNGEQATVSDLKPGDRAAIVQIDRGGARVVRAIRAFSPGFRPESRPGKHRMRGRLHREAPGLQAPVAPPADEALFEV